MWSCPLLDPTLRQLESCLCSLLPGTRALEQARVPTEGLSNLTQNSLDEDDGGDDSSEESSPLILRSSPNGSGAGTGYRVTVYARQCLSTTNLDQLQHEGCTSKGKGAEKLAVREPERSPPGMLGASNYSYECPLCLESHASSVDDEGDDEGLSSISCGHVFGTKCIRAALRQDPRCPLCRVPAPKGREGIRRVFL